MTSHGRYEFITTSQLNPHTVAIGFDNPEKRNAIDQATIAEIDQVLAAHATKPTVVIFHSTTPAMFVSGADIAELIERDADDAMASINASFFDRIAKHRWPTIALIDGYALGGGCELAMACDFRIASPTSTFGQPETRLGIIAGAGANWRLRQLVGLAAARRMLLLGERLDGEQALELGLVDAVCAADQLMARGQQMAERLAKSSWRAIEFTKLALGQNEPTTTQFDITAQALLFESEEKQERMGAFLKPSITNE